ncbi:MAG: putative DUF214 family protein [Streblomastix strix]|uniref:Putative DUF214 family protein n=1 Tax=Streblomastix strix TaxID=222440 RepID=A0A5J4X272_9EUKA|nr:MAG: putative DUF214 family protein [Streblomastix strix]
MTNNIQPTPDQNQGLQNRLQRTSTSIPALNQMQPLNRSLSQSVHFKPKQQLNYGPLIDNSPKSPLLPVYDNQDQYNNNFSFKRTPSNKQLNLPDTPVLNTQQQMSPLLYSQSPQLSNTSNSTQRDSLDSEHSQHSSNDSNSSLRRVAPPLSNTQSSKNMQELLKALASGSSLDQPYASPPMSRKGSQQFPSIHKRQELLNQGSGSFTSSLHSIPSTIKNMNIQGHTAVYRDYDNLPYIDPQNPSLYSRQQYRGYLNTNIPGTRIWQYNKFREQPIEDQSFSNKVLSNIMFFLSQSYVEIKHKKCSFLWGFLSIMMVVMLICVVFSITTKFPVIALMISEAQVGQYDLSIQAGAQTLKKGINATKMHEILSKTGEQYNRFSPRIQFTVEVQSDEAYYKKCDVMKELQIGREWSYTEEIPKGTAIITKQVNEIQKFQIGDKITFFADLSKFCAIVPDLIIKRGILGTNANAIQSMLQMLSYCKIELEIIDIVDNQMGKSGAKQCIFVEYANFWEHVVDTSIPSRMLSIFPRAAWLLQDNMDKRALFKSPLYDYALQAVFAQPEPRTEAYVTFDVESIKKKLVTWTSPILYTLHFDKLQINTDLINSFESIQFFSLLIEMAAIIIIVLLSGISILLIYSQLQISVDTRSFEMGILRMVGLERVGIVGVLITQALLYSVPGIILGLLAAILVNYFLMHFLENMSSIPIDKIIPMMSIIISISVSILISFTASIFPIRQALKQNLHNSVDSQHVKGSTHKVKIERAEELEKSWSVLYLGVVLSGLGAGIYILLPMSLISGSISMLAIVLFSLLMMVLVGLIMITINFEFIFEKLVYYVFLFWETKSVRFMALKNLTAHRERNRKTTLLFSITLAFIAFLNVIASIVMSLVIDQSYHQNGGDFTVSSDTSDALIAAGLQSQYSSSLYYLTQPEELEKEIREEFSDIVDTIAWASPPLDNIYPYQVKTTISNIGRSHSFIHQVYAASSNFMDNVRPSNLIISDSADNRSFFTKFLISGGGDSPIKQLYTSQTRMFSSVLSQGLKNEIAGKANEPLAVCVTPAAQATSQSIYSAYSLFVQAQTTSNPNQVYEQSKLRKVKLYPSTYMKAQPFFKNPAETISDTSAADAPMSVPAFLSLLPDGEQDYEENMKWKSMIIRLKKKGKEGKYAPELEDESDNETVADNKLNRNKINQTITDNKMDKNKINQTVTDNKLNKNKINQTITDNKLNKNKLNQTTSQKRRHTKASKISRASRIEDLQSYLKSYQFILIITTPDKVRQIVIVVPKVWSLSEDTEIVVMATKLIDLGFMAITVLVMFFCMFSLIASMHTNILEQTKEIGIERALGVKRFQLVRVYIEESFVLVISAAVMGMIVGIIVGYMLTTQMSMMQGYPIQFVFPYMMVIISIAAAVLVSILASAGPAWSVVSASIAKTMKTA